MKVTRNLWKTLHTLARLFPNPTPSSGVRTYSRSTSVAGAVGRLKLSIVCLFTLLGLLALIQNILPGFVATGQSTAPLSTPTNVTASDNSYTTKVGVGWDAVRGATLYRVLRSTTSDPATAVSIGTTAAPSFFDTTGGPGQTFFYWVRAENGSNVGALSQPDQGTRATAVVNPGQVPALNPPNAPAGNPVTAAKAYLGKALFWDEQLSSTRTVSCGTCHFATNGGSDSRTIAGSARARNPGADRIFNTADDVFGSPGVTLNNADGTYSLSPIYGFGEQVTNRKSKSYIDAAYSNTLFWDGRATQTFTDPLSGAVLLPAGAALESQVLAPPISSAEMAHTGRNWSDVAARVFASKPLALSPDVPPGLREWIAGRSYMELFAEAFGTSEVTPARIAMAIATFERTVYSDRTPFDASAQGISQLPAAEARGQAIFNGVGRCNTCHSGTLFSDNQFHNIGVRPQAQDPGRFAVTGNGNNLGEFRTPSLRNVGLRGPYFHTGQFATLEEVVDFYNRGGDFDAPNIDRNRIRPIGLSAQQRADLVAFLRNALTDPRVAAGRAPFDRPSLYTESGRVPQITGSGTPGSGGAVPRIIAVEPPLVGNPAFTVAVSNALGGAQAVLVIDTNDPGTGPLIPAAGSLARVRVQLSGSGPSQGSGSVSLQIPNSAALVGQTFFGRWFVTDPAAPGGVAVTPAFRMTIFGEAPPGTTNPIDDAPTFVTQHYGDFLNRAPDAGGLGYWTERISGNSSSNPAPCAAGDSTCVLSRRVSVSAAFFIEAEFQLTGSYIYRMYTTGLGRQPTFAEFTADRNQIDAANLEHSKQAFAEAFAQRAAFVSKYGSNPSAEVFVDALLATLKTYDGVDLSARRVTYISELQGGVTRGQIVREMAEDSAVQSAEYNPSFVLMQYFGYLKRDPEQAGYLFWLNVLNNKTPGNYRGMVCSFITSAEYQQRFGASVTHFNSECSAAQ